MKLVVTLLLLWSLLSCAFAQDVPAKRQLIVPGRYSIRDDAGVVAPAIISGPQGVYVFNKGVLARFDAKTLQQLGMVELYGKMDELTADAKMMDIMARGQRLLPAGMALHGGDIIILSGDQFFRVDPVTLAIKVNASLLPAGQPNTRVEEFLY